MSAPYQNKYAFMKPKRRPLPTEGSHSLESVNKRPRLASPAKAEERVIKAEQAKDEEPGVAGPSTAAGSNDNNKGKEGVTRKGPKQIVGIKVTHNPVRAFKEPQIERRDLMRLITAKDNIAEVFEKVEQLGSAKSRSIDPRDITRIRDELHRLQFDNVSRIGLDRSNLIPKGLALLIDEKALKLEIPPDIRSDALLLKTKWKRADYSTDLLRGIIVRNRKYNPNGPGIKSGTSYAFDKDYPHKISPYCIGHNALQVGAWWPLQICAMRDGAHGEIEAGIHGCKELDCALSIVISGGTYPDFDHGNTLFYCGTKGNDGKLSVSTQYMVKSMEKGTPIRVLRASKCKDSKYRPSVGIRYDGLYQITGKTELPESNNLRFVMERIEGQPPIRYLDPAKGESRWTARPSRYEVHEWEEIRKNRKIAGDW